MERKPDAIKVLVFIFFVGLAATGLSTLQTQDSQVSTAAIIDSPLMPLLDE